MDFIWLLVILILLVLFSSISIVPALRRIADATGQAASHLESLAAASGPKISP
ncbi:hypothetical protein [Diaminobutyricimonas sp. LJ205]|uniref:hypothetical protein n=1 Tax=Diaminobutyricimonas sp. LJ205 TaxID=2683590 RepID=UPI0012F4FDE1|nr:hypothetical protein [Diaminobutyricimonas sp. LJ205]